MTRRIQKRRGRPPVHDPVLIRKLLSERKESGETYAELERRSGIPTSTLARWSRRLAESLARQSDFVEVVIGGDDGGEGGPVPFEIVVPSLGGPPHVVVPAGFDALELQRLLAVLEGRC